MILVEKNIMTTILSIECFHIDRRDVDFGISIVVLVEVELA